MKDGVVYVFVQDHPAGAWDPTHVMATNITTQMELMPDKIVTYVGSQGYGRTFISLTDPALDPANEVRAGDYWIKQDPNVGTWRQASSRTWGDLKEETWYDITNQTSGKWRNVFKKTWGEIKNQTWYDLIDKTAEMYCRKGSADKGEWIPVNDTNAISEAYTRIQQTAESIMQEAHRANAAEGVLDSKITQTAESITQEVRRATSAEEQLSSTIVQTAESITQSVQRTYMAKTEDYQTVDALVNKSIQLADDAATSAKNASIARTDRYQSASAIVESAIAVVDSTSLSNLPDFSANTQYYKGDTVKYNGKSYIFTTNHKGAWNDAHVKEIKPYIAQTTSYQTADAIVTEAVRQASESASGSYIAKTTTYQTADSIVSSAVTTAGTNATRDFIAKSGTYNTVTAILNEAQNKADAAANSAKSASIARTDRYQTAAAIVESAIAVVTGDMDSLTEFDANKQYYIGDAVKYNNKGYKFKNDHKGAWNASHVTEIIPYIAQTTSYQTADSIVTEAVRQAGTNASGAYIAKTTTYQTADSIVTEAVSQAASSASSSYIAKTTTYQTADSIKTEAVKSSAQIIAPAFSTSQAYAKDAIVSYNGKVYKFNQAHAAGAWNANHVTEVQTTSVFSTLEQTASSISAYVTDNAYAKQSGISINANGIDMAGNDYIKIKSVNASHITLDTNGITMMGRSIVIGTGSSKVEINRTNINLDVDASNYVHIGSTGIDMKGTRVTIKDANDHEFGMWARDDIIVLKSGDNEDTVIANQTAAGAHDWVLIKPYYNAKINYLYSQTYGINTSSNARVVLMSTTVSEADSFANGADWYNYRIRGTINKKSSESESQITLKVYLSNEDDQSDEIHFSGTVDLRITSGEVNFNISSGHRTGNRSNKCRSGENMYLQLVCDDHSYSNVYNIRLECTCAASTSKVPCMVYYFP